jgi:hypothetical protein
VRKVAEPPLTAQGKKTAAQLALHGGRRNAIGIREEVGAEPACFHPRIERFPNYSHALPEQGNFDWVNTKQFLLKISFISVRFSPDHNVWMVL